MPTLIDLGECVLGRVTLFRGRLHLPRIVLPSTHWLLELDLTLIKVL